MIGGSDGGPPHTKLVRDALLSLDSNYSRVTQAIGEVRNKVNSGCRSNDIKDLVKEIRNGKQAISRIQIRQTKEKLNPTEIKEVNTLLQWLAYGFGTFTIDKLDAAVVSSTLVTYLACVPAKHLPHSFCSLEASPSRLCCTG